jgi:hypothetical protein
LAERQPVRLVCRHRRSGRCFLILTHPGNLIKSILSFYRIS